MPTTETEVIYHVLKTELTTLSGRLLTDLHNSVFREESELATSLKNAAITDWPDYDKSVIPLRLRADFVRIEAILATLSQIELNLYGICADCEQPIEPERLQADLTCQRCSRCSS